MGEVGSGGGRAPRWARGNRRERARAPEPAGRETPRPLERQVQRKRVSGEVAAGEGRGRGERKGGGRKGGNSALGAGREWKCRKGRRLGRGDASSWGRRMGRRAE